MALDEGLRFEIHTFPSDDHVLEQRAREIASAYKSADDAFAAVESALRVVHPSVAVRLRSPLAGYGRSALYVFRDGTAAPSEADDAWLEDPATARVVSDGDGTYLDANAAAAQLFGVDVASILGRRCGDFTHSDARVRSADALWNTVERSGRLHSTALLSHGRRVEFVTISDGDGPGRNVTYLRPIA